MEPEHEIRCFFLEPTDQFRVYLRRYAVHDDCCPGSGGCHNACRWLPSFLQQESRYNGQDFEPMLPHDDPLWPQVCEVCSYQFLATDEWQHRTERLYRRSDNGGLLMLRDAPAGAMWYADWMTPRPCSPDGRTLVVRLPNRHDWMPDAQASNCTRPDDKQHGCWVRHGTPPDVTVDKNGNTCEAGAGSIQTPDWHGFLQGGVLRRC